MVAESVCCRAVRSALAWLTLVGSGSLVGRFFIALARVLARVGGDSVVFGLGRTCSRPLGRDGHPWSVLALSRSHLWLRSRLITLPRSGVASHLGRGAWVVLLGAGIFALGCGRLALILARGSVAGEGADPAVSQLVLVGFVLLVIVGAILVVAGPGLIRALPESAIGRGGRRLGLTVVEGRDTPARRNCRWSRADVSASSASQAGTWRHGHPVVWAGAVLTSIAGFVLGLTSGATTFTVVALIVAVCLLVLVLWRVEIVLLCVAAFPWVDWAARGTLGRFGPAWDDALLVVSFILLLWAVLVYRRARLWTVPLFVPALLCLVMAIGSVVVGDVRTNVAVFALRVLFQPLLFYFIGFLFPKNKRWVQWTVAVFLVAGVALAAHGLFQYVTHAPMPTRWVDASETHISTRAYSIIENPNGLGAILLIGTLISFSLALGRGLPRIQRLLLAAVCAVQLAGVAVTFSRGAWLGLAAGVFALLILAYRRYLVPLVAVGALGWFVAPARFTERLVFAFSSTYIAKSMVAGRLLVWKMALQHAAAHPLFGLGLGTFGGTAAVRFGYGRLWVDNFYLQLAAEGGVILLIAFLWVLLRAAKGLVKAYVQSADPYLQPLAAGTFGAFIAVAAANVTASVWETLVVGVAFWFFAGLVTSAVLHAVPCEECRNTVVGETVVGAAGATRNMPPDAALDRSVS